MALIFPILLPFFVGLTAIIYKRSNFILYTISIISALLNLIFITYILHKVVYSGPQVVFIGDWPAPFGISLVADRLSALMMFVIGFISLTLLPYFKVDLGQKKSHRLYYVLIHFLMAASYGVILTGDLFNLYVWLEVILVSSVGLMSLEGGKQNIQGSLKYLILNIISTLVILLAVAFLYGNTGTLNMADLHTKVSLLPVSTSLIIAGLFLFGFAIKAALFPVNSWLPASYPTLPSAIVAFFAMLQTKVVIYIFLRVYTLIFVLDSLGLQPLLFLLAGFTMVMGVLGATSRESIKEILSFHIISQIGYMIMGLTIYTPLAIAGAILFMFHNMIVKTNLFLIGGILERKYGTDSLLKLGNGYRVLPWLSILFIISAFSLAGFPPLSGFWGKFVLVKESFRTENVLIAVISLIVSIFTLYSMTKIWAGAFLKSSENKRVYKLSQMERLEYYLPVGILAFIAISVCIAMEPLIILLTKTAQDLLNPQAYVRAVMGGA